jgi:hypothetical protein
MANQSRSRDLRDALEFLGFVEPQDLDRFPDFLVIAPPKTGTTWLSVQLARHPGIFCPATKELRYFSFFRKFRGLAWYLSQFQEAGSRLKGEATPNYALLPTTTIRLIHDLRPDLKLIYLMRDPIERAWSNARWDHHLRIGSFASQGADLDDVTEAQWRECCLRPSIVLFGDYLGQLERWLQVFDRSQLFIGFTEQIKSSPQGLLNAIFDFLGAGRSDQFDEAELNEQANPGVARALTVELRECLRSIYAGRTRQLIDFVRREFALEAPVEWNASLSGLNVVAPASQADGGSADDVCSRLAQGVDDDQLAALLDLEEQWSPHIFESIPEWNLVQFRGRIYGVPWKIGPVDFFDPAQLAKPEILVAATASEIKRQINQAMQGPEIIRRVDTPILVAEGYRGYNIVEFRQQHFALAQSLGNVHLMQVDDAWLAARRQSREICVGDSTIDVKQQVDEIRPV